MLTQASFEAMGTVNTVAVDGEEALPEALAMVRSQIAEIDAVCSRFRADSELSRLNRSAGTGDFELHPLLEEAIVAAMHVAEMTEGLVDPTIGRHLEDTGYTVTFSAIQKEGPPLELRIRKVAGWRAVELDRDSHTACLPVGVALDLGASGKAWAADRAAEAVASSLGIGVLVDCGGDVSVRGPIPGHGWPVRVASDVGAAGGQDVLVRDGGLATSGTTSRRWRRGGVEIHDIIDPRTGLPAQTPWAMVTVAAATCLEANAASTAALIMGEAARPWLEACRLPARLVRSGGGVELAAGWCS